MRCAGKWYSVCHDFVTGKPRQMRRVVYRGYKTLRPNSSRFWVWKCVGWDDRDAERVLARMEERR